MSESVLTPRKKLRGAKRIVLKAGTTILTSRKGLFSKKAVARLGREITSLLKGGREAVLVTSGAIACGMETLRFKHRPKELRKLQACAAIGQGKLMRAYEEFFSRQGTHTAQLLLTRDAMEIHSRFLNAKRTFDELFSLGILPIVNENDTVSTEEITFGDNDLLSVWVANLVRADLLVFLTDVDGFHLQDGSRIHVVEDWRKMDRTLFPHLRDEKKARSVGGMKAKLEAAQIAMRSGIPLLLVNGHEEGILEKVLRGEDVGTLFVAGEERWTGRENWIAFSAPKRGALVVDQGAYDALVRNRKSLLPRGVLNHEGRFERGEVVELRFENQVFGRGVAGYSCEETAKIAGRKTDEIEKILGYKYRDELIHRNDLVVWG
jgi:glutamate 5-kinase